MSQYPAVIELSSLDGNNGFRINGEANDDYSGISVASAGDFNGDGFADLIIGAIGADPHGSFSGASYVVFGKASGFTAVFNLSDLSGSNGFQINGVAAGDFSGISVASAGDVNGDGFADLIVGAHYADLNGSNSGASYVVFGKASGLDASFELSSLAGGNGFRIDGEAANDQCGYSVASAGDVNGDGFADLIVGSRYADPNGDRSGASYVVFGKASGFSAAVQLSSLDGSNGFKINGDAIYIQSGRSVASAGDVNGDGYDDVIVGAPSANLDHVTSGTGCVVFGRASGFAATIDVSSLDGSNGFRIRGVSDGDNLGCSVASAGDVNGDGFSDLIVGADHVDANGFFSGASYVVFGRASGFGAVLATSSLDGSNGFQISGEAVGDNSGESVASVGDFNGDGFDDLIVGARDADPNGNLSGASYVVFGKATGFAATLELSNLNGNDGFQINGEAAGDFSGRSVAGAGDINGDGFADLIVGAWNGPQDTYAGESYVLFGAMPGEAVTRTGTAIANTIHGGDFNDTLVGLAGDDHLIGHGSKDMLEGGRGNDALDGGDGKDTLNGGAGKDKLNGGSEADVFVYNSAAESTGKNHDIVSRANFAADKWDVPGSVIGIDPIIAHGALSGGSAFDANLAVAVDAGHLDVHHAVFFTPNSGTLSGKTIMIVDMNGIAGYQAGADLVVQLGTPHNIASFDVGDFL